MESNKEFFVHESSYVDEHVTIGKGTKIWHFCHIQKGSSLGERAKTAHLGRMSMLPIM